MTTHHPAALAGAEHATAVSIPYWEALAEGRFVLQRCTACTRYQHYPRRICRHCSSESLEFASASGTGTVFAATLVHRSNSHRASPSRPYWLAIVRTDEEPLLFALLSGVPAELDGPDRGSGLQGARVELDWAEIRSTGLLAVHPIQP
jgi:uncharacterized OB-fold protein